ncbi:MAG: hypothetical protein ACJ77Z_07455 [Thermoleophilaceae bacterium]
MAADRLDRLRQRTRYVSHDVEPCMFQRRAERRVFRFAPGGTPDEDEPVAAAGSC